MHDPAHPGQVINELCLKPLSLTVTEAAAGLGISRTNLSLLLNGRAGLSPDMALRLSEAFGSTPETWLGLQMQYDLWVARRRARRARVKVRRFVARKPRAAPKRQSLAAD